MRASEAEPAGAAFLQALRVRGHIDGKSVIVDTHAAGVAYAGLSRYAEQLSNRGSAAILAEGWAATEAAREATSKIPVVMVGVPDADRGLVKSLSHPGGNVTGVSYPYALIVAKQLELLREIAPKARLVGVLVNPVNPEHRRILPVVRATGVQMQIDYVVAEARLRSDIADAMSTLKKADVDAVLVLGDQVLVSGELPLYALTHRLPTISLKPEFVKVGGLISYGPSDVELAKRIAFFVDRLLRGANPGSLPVEQPTRYELVVNVTTAKALGLTLPPSVLLRADRVIE